MRVMSGEIEIGRSKRARQAYSFDDIAVVPARRTRDVRDVRVRLPGDGVEGPREEHGAVVRSGYDRNGGVHPDPFVPIPSFCHSHPEGRPSRPSGPEVELISVWAATGPGPGSPASIGSYE